MRKIFLVLLLLLCSCELNDEFSRTCKYEVKNKNFKEKTIMEIMYNGDDQVKEAFVTKDYKSSNDGLEIISDIKASINEYNNKYGDTGIRYEVIKDTTYEYKVRYYLPVKDLSDDVLNDFKLQKNSIKLFRKLEIENIECEG